MDLSRRKFFGLSSAVAAVAAIPVTAYAVEQKKKSEVVPPRLLERVCWVEYEQPDSTYYRGCGTRFQWYLGTGCVCPKCYRHYCVTAEDLDSGKFNPQSAE